MIFDLYNEPYTGSWACWRDGGSACNDVGFTAAGMQQLVNTVRAAGAGNVLLLGCLGYSNDCQDSNGSWTQYLPSDPDNNLAASVHVYIGNGCATASCWTSTFAPILQAGHPIVMGEFGDYDYNGQNPNQSFATGLLNWMDQSQASGYIAWTWNNWGNTEALITSDDGSNLSTWGQYMATQYAQRFP